MSQDFETLPIGTEAALRALAEAFEVQETRAMVDGDWEPIDKARAILAQIDAQRKGVNDGK